MKKIVNLTHHDLDGIVSHIIVTKVFGKENIIDYHCGYGKIINQLNKMVDIKDKYDIDTVIVTDMALEPYHLKILTTNFDKVIVIDHHQTSEIFLDKQIPKKLKVIYDNTKCGALLTYEFFENKLNKKYNLKELANLYKLVMLANDYDLWKLKDNKSYILNEVFWSYGWDKFYSKFKNGFIEHTPENVKMVKNKIKIKKDYLKSADKELIGDKGVFILDIESSKDSISNDITLFLKDYNFYFVYLPKTNQISIRVRNVENVNIAESMNRVLNQESNVKSYGGHPFAGGFILEEDIKEDKFYGIIEELYDDMNKVANNIL